MKNAKFLFRHLLTMGMALGSIQSLADTTEVQFDFERINASISKALTEYSATTQGSSSLMYSLDPQLTDVEKDQYQFNIRLDLAKAPGTNSPLSAIGTMGIKTDRSDPSERGLTLSFDTTFKTDVLPMLVKKITASSHCDAVEKSHGIVQIFWSRHCEYVARLPEVKTIDGLYDLLMLKTATHKADFAAYHVSLESALALEELKPEEAKNVRALLKNELKRTDAFINFANGVIVNKTETGFILDVPTFAECPLMSLNGMHIVVNPTDLSVKGEVHLQFGKSLYAAARPVIVDVLRGLEAGDPAAIKLVKYDAEIHTNLILGM